MAEGKGRCITILEVSQKQSYIFSSNLLKNNIIASDTISYVTSTAFLEKEFPDFFTEKDNLVYAGGGHIMLTFETREIAVAFAKKVSLFVMKKFDGIEIFVKTLPYTGNPAENRKELVKQLEMKKSIRRMNFRQGSFGMEYLRLEDKLQEKNEMKRVEKEILNSEIPNLEAEWIKPYKSVNLFSELGGSKFDSNYIAVVHVDGNLMGKRVGKLDEKLLGNQGGDEFEAYRAARKKFSDDIDKAYGDSYKEMIEIVKKQIKAGNLSELHLLETMDKDGKIKTEPIKDQPFIKENCNFPIRKIILAGDDVCFVTEGRIGIECAVTFVKQLWDKAVEEGEDKYSACAGVAIVHEKYPFGKAFELAEKLCSNAKREISHLVTNGEANISAIDWHIERGEMYGSVSDMRKQYTSNDGTQLAGRPYIICLDEKYNTPSDAHKISDDTRYYENWKECLEKFCSSKEASASSKLKGLFQAMKQGDEAFNNYRQLSLQKDINEKEKKYLFDAIELMDTFIPFGED